MRTRLEQGILVIDLEGELDHHGVEQIRDKIERELAQAHYQGLVMSFRNIDFMDSSGLGLILGRLRTLSENGGQMALCEVGPSLKKLFDMSGVLSVLPLYDDEKSAVQGIKGA